MGPEELIAYRNKLKLLYLKEILERYTDRENGLSHAEIMDLLKRRGIEVKPRTLRDDLYCLQEAAEDLGMCVETNIQDGKEKAHPIRYRLTERPFTPTEVKLLMESVKGIHSLSEEQTMLLHKKLEGLCSHPEAVKMRGRLAVVGGFKAYWSKRRQHDVLLTNIEVIDQALDENKKVEFRYYWYSTKKVPTYPRDKEHTHIVSPLVRVLESGFYYLVAVCEDKQVRHFRMDRMTNLKVTDAKNAAAKDEKWKTMNWENYVNSSFGLGITNQYQLRRRGERHGLHGVDNKLYTVHMSFTRDLVGVVMDRFGTGVTISPTDKGHFTAVVNVYYNAQFVKWVMGLGNKVRILSPDNIIDDVAYYGRAIGRWHKRVKGD